MAAGRARWGLTLTLIGLAAIAVLLAALVDEYADHAVPAIAAGLIAIALPLGWFLVGSSSHLLAFDWWFRQRPSSKTFIAATWTVVTLGVLVEAISTGSLVTGGVLFVGVIGILAGVALVVDLVDTIARRFGAWWAPRLVDVSVLVASGASLLALVAGGLLEPTAAPGIDDLAAAGMLGIPIGLMVAVVGDATVRAWQEVDVSA